MQLVTVKEYFEENAYKYVRGQISAFGPKYGYMAVYSRDGHTWSTNYPTTWYGIHFELFYAAMIHYKVEDDKTMKLWTTSEISVIGVK